MQWDIKAIQYAYPNTGINDSRAGEEPEGPPAALESCAKHIAGGLARRQ
jgi:hypothetical protein